MLILGLTWIVPESFTHARLSDCVRKHFFMLNFGQACEDVLPGEGYKTPFYRRSINLSNGCNSCCKQRPLMLTGFCALASIFLHMSVVPTNFLKGSGLKMVWRNRLDPDFACGIVTYQLVWTPLHISSHWGLTNYSEKFTASKSIHNERSIFSY